MANDPINNYFNGSSGSLDMDALFQIFGIKKPKSTDPLAPVYGPQTGTPGQSTDINGLLGSVAPMAGNVPTPSWTAPPASGAFWLQDIVNRAHNATRVDPTTTTAAKKSNGGK